MRTDKQIQASRANGARSHGPVTPEGKRNSAHNSTRHALLASTVVLEEEIEERFHDLLEEYTEDYQPRTATETSLIETMAVARWRLLRVWGAQKTAMDRDMALQDRNVGPAPVRCVLALRGSPESTCPSDVLLRYEIAFDRQFSRALARLLVLQSKPATRPTPYFPKTSTGHTWKGDSTKEPGAEPEEKEPATTKRTQETIEKQAPPPGPSLSRDLALPDLSAAVEVQDEQPREVIAVARDSRLDAHQQASQPVMYVAYNQQPPHNRGPFGGERLNMAFVVRPAAGLMKDSTTFDSALRQAVAEVDPNQPVAGIQSVERNLMQQVDAVATTLLAAAGVYGVMSYTVAQRTREIGLRVALGASRREVFRMMIRRALILVATGVAVGLAGSFGLTRLMASLLWGVKATDPLTFTLVTLVLAAVSLLACVLPTRRAVLVDPTVALRHE
jgi:hypothetical protein